mgnify:CR=1 FL=1
MACPFVSVQTVSLDETNPVGNGLVEVCVELQCCTAAWRQFFLRMTAGRPVYSGSSARACCRLFVWFWGQNGELTCAQCLGGWWLARLPGVLSGGFMVVVVSRRGPPKGHRQWVFAPSSLNCCAWSFCCKFASCPGIAGSA